MSDHNTTPAFPSAIAPFNDGMTLRDYFAAKAMQAIISGNHQLMSQFRGDFDKKAEDVCDRLFQSTPERAYSFADAMLKERAK